MGLWQVVGQPTDTLFKVSGGVCRGRFTKDELRNCDKLQEVAPKNVHVLRTEGETLAYLQEVSGQWQAAGLFRLDGVEVEFELDHYSIGEEVLYRAMMGNHHELVEALRFGAATKVA